MGPLPPELSAGPPRDPASAPHLFARGAMIVRAAFTLVVLVPVICVASAALLAGPDEVKAALVISLVLAVAFAAAGAGMSVQRNRTKRLFREGVVTTGRVAAIRSPGRGNRYVFVDVEYADHRGVRFVGTAMTNRLDTALDFGVGHQVPILYLPQQPDRFALFSRALGLLSGLGKR